MSGADEMMEICFVAGADRAVWIWNWRLDAEAFVALSTSLE